MTAPIGGIWAPATLRAVRTAAYKASQLIRAKLAAAAARPANNAVLEPVLARNAPRQPTHPIALLRQSKNRRWHSTTSAAYQHVNAAVRRFMSTGRLDAGNAARVDRTKFNGTQVGRAVAQFTGRAPFASALRPNLTGGALPRTAGGYGLGSGRVGGARYFSHAPAAQAQVVQNVSAAVRAFWISGQKAQFDGLTAHGERKYRSVSALQDETARKLAALPRSTPGSYVEFRLNPTVTALSPLAAAFPYPPAGFKVPALDATTLNTDGFLDVLSGDFARALKDLTTTLADMKKLSSLGDLPVHLEKGHTLRVRFPGVDRGTVESLCDDLGVRRGIVMEDPDFEAETGVTMALKFPFAPDVHNDTRTLTSPSDSLRSEDSFFRAEEELFEEGFSDLEDNPWLSLPDDPEGYESMSPPISSGEHCSQDSEGLDGIYKFLEECDRSRGRF
ncbi:hypothetical protein F4781DRAFT_379923 [Annulohypoxylon bovei var. microspora]|nr:hypothetical protein F4781DRAFT_379923 [Annulohypoxylon bovei var. microspora]